MFAIGLAGYITSYRSCAGERAVRQMTSITHLVVGRQDMDRNTSDEPDTETIDPRDATQGVPDHRETDHPAGEDHAKRNQENEPVA